MKVSKVIRLIWRLIIPTACLYMVFVSPSLASVNETFGWDAVKTPFVCGYKIYYKDSGSLSEEFDGTDADQGASPVDVPVESLADPDHPQYTLTGLDDDKEYIFAITAYDCLFLPLESGFSELAYLEYTPPTSTITFPGQDEQLNAVSVISGTSQDNLSGVESILLLITDGVNYLQSDNTWTAAENWITIRSEDLSS